MARKYPYSQIVQLMYGLRLRTSSEHLFNQQLGKTAALTNNRAVLFELFENKPRTLNAGVETFEVDQAVPTPVLPKAKLIEPAKEEALLESSEVPPSKAVEPISPEIEKKTPEPIQPVEETIVPPTPPIVAKKVEKAEKKELPSATPENMDGLSPQERVQAILKRNRELRAQFDAQKGGEEEKLWGKSNPKETQATEAKSTSSLEEEVPSSEDRREEPVKAAADGTVDNPTEALAPDTAEISPTVEENRQASEELEDAPTEIDREAILSKIQKAEWTEEIEDSPEQESPKDISLQGSELQQQPEELKPDSAVEPDSNEDEKEPWADSPIDIEALIRRRFSRSYEPLPEDEGLWADDNEEQEEPETVSELNAEAEMAEEPIAAENQSEELTDATTTQPPITISKDLKEEEASEPLELKSDLALASRIRAIRERMEGLKDNEVISREELEILMEEHRQLEALMADLPLDEDQLFEVEVQEAGDMEEEAAVLKEEPSAGGEPQSEESASDPDYTRLETALPKIQEETPAEDLSGEISEEKEEIDEPLAEMLEEENTNADQADEEAVSEPMMPVVHLNVAELESKGEVEGAEREEVDAVEQTESAQTGLSRETSEKEPEEKSLEGQEDSDALSANQEQSGPTISSQKEARSETKEDDSSEPGKLQPESHPSEKTSDSSIAADSSDPPEEEDLDAEIRRIEALAAQLKSGRSHELSKDQRHSVREERMNEMIEERKRSLEDHAAKVESESANSQEKHPVPEEEVKEQESDLPPNQEINKADDDEPQISEQEETIEEEEAETAVTEEAETAVTEEATTATTENKLGDDPSSETELQSDEVFEVELKNDEETYKAGHLADFGTDPKESAAKPDSEEPASIESERESEPGASETEKEETTSPSFSDWLKQVAQGSASEETESHSDSEEQARLVPEEENTVETDEADEAEADESGESKGLKEATLDREAAVTKDSQAAEHSDKEDSSTTEDAQKGLASGSDSSDADLALKEEQPLEIDKKIGLLDSFVEKLPDLKKQSRDSARNPRQEIQDLESDEKQGSGLVTETLAKVYIRQKHYKKAIQAYQILMLKYPEKSSFFADQISEIKKLANSKS